MKVNEIFYSLQGEGHFAGTAAVFVRFSGCNLRCPFCDTAHEDGREMTVDEILREVCVFPARHVVITGGEPALQITGELLRALRGEGFFVQMETNGTVALPADAVELVNWITCSPKLGRTDIQRVDELKVLYTPETEDVLEQWAMLGMENGAVLSLQPCDTGDAERNRVITAGVVEYVKAHPQWHLSLQTHKLIDIR